MKKLLSLVLGLGLIFSLTACGSTEVIDEPVKEVESVNELTITFKDDLIRLGQLKVNEGELLTGYEEFEEKNGFEFLGWYETPSFHEASKKNLSTDTFSKNTVLYGSWKSLVKTEDTRTFYVVGDGLSPVLKASAWAGADVSDADKEVCKFKATGRVNEYSITLDLFKDDMFQVIYDWQWDGQYGFGKVSSYDPSQMESGGGLSGEASKANVLVLMDGSYTITLCTDVDNPALDEFTIERNGDPSGDKAEEEAPFVPGEKTTVVMKGSWVEDWSENIEMTKRSGEDLVFFTVKEFNEGTELYFMIWDDGKDTGIGMNASNVVGESQKFLEEAYNVKINKTGKYEIVADVNNMTLQLLYVLE